MSASDRPLSLPRSVAPVGLDAWNSHPDLKQLSKTMAAACQATTVAQAVAEVKGLMSVGHNLWAYMYLRYLFNKNLDLYYATVASEPGLLLPVAYTPTVGEACQKFGLMPQYPRGCFVSVADRGNVKTVLEEYAKAMLPCNDGKYECECIVFSDGGRILGLGDLAAWGMGIPVGKLDLYTVCGGFNPRKTIPVIIDAGCSGPEGNSARLTIRDHPLYTGLKQDRVKEKSPAGTEVNSAYYGDDSFIKEFMTAAADLFGADCLLQFEDFNSNDAFPLLAEYRDKFLCYNDDIQGTAAVAVAAMLGGLKIQKPEATDLISEVRKLTILFHGAGSANLGGASLLLNEGGVPSSQVFITNSRGIIWKSQDGTTGSFRNDEQKAVAQVGKPDYDSTDLVKVVQRVKPDILVGAVGRVPNCFTKAVIEAMCAVQDAKPAEQRMRPVVFALSNPKTQAEITAQNCYEFSKGRAIFGSGTRFDPVEYEGVVREPGQVNNFFIFPGMSFGAMKCAASTIPEKFFMLAANAVANTLDEDDIKAESVVPNVSRIRMVNAAVATAVVLAAQESGLAGTQLVAGEKADDPEAVKDALLRSMWTPSMKTAMVRRSTANFGELEVLPCAQESMEANGAGVDPKAAAKGCSVQ